MGELQVDLEYLRRIDKDHACLAKQLDKLSEAFVERTDLDLLIKLLVATRDQVAAHFNFEEQGAYLDDAVSYAPQLTSRAEHLLRQHAEFLQRIEDLVKEVKSSSPDQTNWNEVQKLCHEFVAQLIEHEREEYLLIQEAYQLDNDPPD